MTRPLGVAFVAPSVTSYVNLNPGEFKNYIFQPCSSSTALTVKVLAFLFKGYRVYYVDGNYRGTSRLVLDHETYFLNLTEANHHGPGAPGSPEPSPKWKLLYRASKAYGLTTVFPADYNRLLQTLIKDDQVFQKFWYLRHKGHVSEPCKETCKTTVLCLLRSGRSDDLEQCDLLGGFGGNLARAARKTLC